MTRGKNNDVVNKSVVWFSIGFKVTVQLLIGSNWGYDGYLYLNWSLGGGRGCINIHTTIYRAAVEVVIHRPPSIPSILGLFCQDSDFIFSVDLNGSQPGAVHGAETSSTLDETSEAAFTQLSRPVKP